MDKRQHKQIGLMPTYRLLFSKFGAVGEKAIIKIIKDLYLADCLMILSKLSRHYCKYIQLGNNGYPVYKKYCLELLDDEIIKAITTDEIKTNKKFDIIFPELSILHLTKLCLKFCDRSDHTKEKDFPKIVIYSVGKCLLIVNDIMNDWQSRGTRASDNVSEELRPEMLVNFTKQMIADRQFDVYQKLYQTLFLFYQLLRQYKEKIDLNRIFIERYGVNVEEYFAFLFLLYAQFVIKNNDTEDWECPYFNLDIALKDVNPKFSKFLLENLILPESEYKKIDLNFFDVIDFIHKPLVEVRDKIIIPISLKRLFISLTDGVYFDVLDSIKNDIDKKTFSTYFGYAIEDYFKDIIYNISKDVIFSFKYGRPEKATPDAILIQGDDVIFFECKKRQFHTAEFLKYGNADMYFKRLNDFCFKPLDQVCKRAADFRNKIFLLSSVKNDCTIYPVIICPDAPPLFSGAWDKFNLDDYILPEYYKEDKKMALPEFIDFVELEAIEEFIRKNPNQSIVNLIKKKRSDKNFANSNWSLFLYTEGIYNINVRLREKYQLEIKKFKSLLFTKNKC